MANAPASFVAINAIGTHVPDKRVTNEDLDGRLDTSDEWITSKTGIRERRIADQGQLASDLAVHAVNDACNRAQTVPEDLDLIILSTWTADHLNPPTSAALLRKLDISVPAFDIHAGGCAASIVSLDVGARYLSSIQKKTSKVAVVLSEVNSKMVNWEDRSTAVFLGDGAACYILDNRADNHIKSAHTVVPDFYELAWVPAGGRALPAHDVARNLGFFHMDGRKIWEVLHNFLPNFIQTFLSGVVDISDIDLVITHQGNLTLLHSLLSACGLDGVQTHTTVERLGNTAGASVPLTLSDAERNGKLQRDDTVLLVAFGAGLTVGASLWRW